VACLPPLADAAYKNLSYLPGPASETKFIRYAFFDQLLAWQQLIDTEMQLQMTHDSIILFHG
jgi:hypothetical protein